MYEDSHREQLNLYSREARIWVGSLSLNGNREQIVKRLTNMSLNLKFGRCFWSNLERTLFKFSDWIPKYGKEKYIVLLSFDEAEGWDPDWDT